MEVRSKMTKKDYSKPDIKIVTIDSNVVVVTSGITTENGITDWNK